VMLALAVTEVAAAPVAVTKAVADQGSGHHLSVPTRPHRSAHTRH
jgi:hypothetical protein